MASLTRSNRRTEGLFTHHHNLHAHGGGTVSGPLTRPRPAIFQRNSSGGRGSGRTKRGLEVSERDFEALKPKKARIAVEILAKPRPVTNDAVIVPPPRPRPSGATIETSIRPPQVPPPRKSNIAAQDADVSLTKHQEKVRKGIKHELDRLQAQPTDPAEQPGRKLRSQEATRFKSELSAYFPDYDEVVGNDPKENRTLNGEPSF
jgi:hypothetical protein